LIIWGGKDVPSQLPFHASSLYARNVVNLLLLMVKDGKIAIDFTDEIIDAAALTHEGVNRNPKGAK
jgi:NAD(P) transhydrogenase subunit alpha